MARYKEQIGDIAVFYIRKDGEIDYHVHTFKGTTLWDESKRIGIRGQVFHGREELNKYLDKIRDSQSELQSKEIEFLNKLQPYIDFILDKDNSAHWDDLSIKEKFEVLFQSGINGYLNTKQFLNSGIVYKKTTQKEVVATVNDALSNDGCVENESPVFCYAGYKPLKLSDFYEEGYKKIGLTKIPKKLPTKELRFCITSDFGSKAWCKDARAEADMCYYMDWVKVIKGRIINNN